MFRFTILLVCVLVPLVTSAVLRPIDCGPVCAIYCPYGNVLDANGCPTCRCNPSPCKNGQSPLDGYFCGNGSNQKECPSNSTCVIAPNDAYAVCCPRWKTG